MEDAEERAGDGSGAVSQGSNTTVGETGRSTAGKDDDAGSTTELAPALKGAASGPAVEMTEATKEVDFEPIGRLGVGREAMDALQAAEVQMQHDAEVRRFPPSLLT